MSRVVRGGLVVLRLRLEGFDTTTEVVDTEVTRYTPVVLLRMIQNNHNH